MESTNHIALLKEPKSVLRETDADEDHVLELGLLLDVTGSMQSWITRAKETIHEIVDQIIEGTKEDGEMKIRVCFIGYRDIRDSVRFEVCPFTEDISQLKQFIAKVKADGGCDHPEDVQGGMKLCLMQDWTK